MRIRLPTGLDQPNGGTKLALDTKWKHLLSDEEGSKNGVSQADIYQLYAYANRYECSDNVLLFPLVKGASSKVYRVEGKGSDYRIRVELIDLNIELLKDGPNFRIDLARILFAGHEERSAYDSLQ